MTSLLQSPSLTDADGLRGALVDVAGQSFFAFAEACSGEEIAAEELADGAWTSARMAFASPLHRGEVFVALPLSLARDLASAFAGCDPEDLTSDMVADVTGELCNMFCGLWLTRTRPDEAFGLQPPEVRSCGAPILSGPCSFMRVNGVPVTFGARGPEPV